MAFQVVASFLQPPIGLYADRHGIGWIMPFSILTGAIFVCVVTLVNSVWMLVAIIILSGFCSSGFHPVAGGIVPQIAVKGRNVLSTSIFIAGGNIGFAVSPMIVAIFLNHFNDSQLPWLSLPAVFTAALIFMRRLHIRHPSANSIDALPGVRDILRNRDFTLLTLSIGLRSWCYCAFVMYLPLLLSSHGFDSVSSASAVMLMLLGTAVGGLAVGTISLKTGLKKIIMGSYLISLIFCSLFLWRADLSAISYLALFLTGAGLYGSTPAAIVWSEKLLSSQSAAFATSMMLGFTFGVGYMLSVITGAIGDTIGLQAGFAVTIIPALIVAMLILAIIRDPDKAA